MAGWWRTTGRGRVVDEWPDEQSFQAFFEEAGPRIEQMMGAAGVTSEPSIEFWRHLDVGDDDVG